MLTTLTLDLRVFMQTSAELCGGAQLPKLTLSWQFVNILREVQLLTCPVSSHSGIPIMLHYKFDKNTVFFSFFLDALNSLLSHVSLYFNALNSSVFSAPKPAIECSFRNRKNTFITIFIAFKKKIQCMFFMCASSAFFKCTVWNIF